MLIFLYKLFLVFIFLITSVFGKGFPMEHNHREPDKYIKRLNSETYHPPSHCAVSVGIKENRATLFVEGKNSSVFCRRVVSSFSDDNVFSATEVIYKFQANQPVPICVFRGEGFKVNVVSENSRFGEFICDVWKNQSL